MPKFSDVVKSESKTLSAKDLKKPVRVTISRWEMMEFDNDGKKVEKCVVFFENAEKGVVLNQTRGMQIAMNLGTEEMDAWVGKQIILEKGRTTFGPDMVDCVAVRDEAPKQEVDDDDPTIPF